MKKVAGFSFSPRKLGNCEIAIKEIANNIREEFELDFVNVSKYNIKPCVACYSCLFNHGNCKIQDDFSILIDKIKQADALIFAVPSYFLGPNSSFKLMIDRFLTFYGYFEDIYNKPSILITTAGVKNGGEGYVDLALRVTARALNLDVVGSAILYGALPGEILLSQDNRDTIKSLAQKLFLNKVDENKLFTNHCNICGSKYFEFLEYNSVRCLVCKNKGKIVFENGEFNIHIENGDIFYGSREATLKHRDWLMGMKERFINEREQLKELTRKYL